jgi:sodium/potassium-transporting ATPase subunit alpha
MIVICVLTDIWPSLAMMVEKPEKDLMLEPPRRVKKDHLVDFKLLFHAYFFIGLMEAFFSHFMYFLYLYWYGGFSPSDVFLAFDKWNVADNATYHNYTSDQLNEFLYTGQSITFISLVIMQVFGNLYATRTNYLSFFKSLPVMKKNRNIFMFVAQIISLVFMILTIFLPFVNSLFKTRQVPVQFFFIPIVFALVIFAADEFRKFLVRRKILYMHKIAW